MRVSRRPRRLRRIAGPVATGGAGLQSAWRSGVGATRRGIGEATRRLGGEHVRDGWRRLPAPVRRWAWPVTAIALACTYPFYVNHLFTIPILGAWPTVNTAVIMLVFTMMAVGLNVVVGYAGLLDLGYVAFYALGAYTVGWLASAQFSQFDVRVGAVGVQPGIPGIHLSVWMILIIAAAFTALCGVLIGLPTLRLRGDYLAIVTLGFGEILPQVARNGDDFLGTGFNLTSGAFGISPVDPLGFGSWIGNHTSLPADFLTEPNSINLYFWSALALLLLTVFCVVRLRDSRLGRAWIAIREDETAAAAMGIPLMRTKTWAYAIGATFGGLAGGFYASFKGSVFPDDFFFGISVLILSMVILGGLGSVWGAIAGGLLLSYLNYEGLSNIGDYINTHVGTSFDVPKYSFMIFGIILVVVMLFRPQGLIPEARRKAEFETGVHDTPLYDVQHHDERLVDDAGPE